MRQAEEWRQLALARVARAEEELGSAGEAPGADDVRALLQAARDAAEAPGSLLRWWEGSDQEKAWLNLHEAEADMLRFLADDELRAHSADVLREAEAILGKKDSRVTSLREDVGHLPASHDQVVAEATHLTRSVYDKRDESYAQSRTFRNRLIRLTGIALVGDVLLIIAVALSSINLGKGIPGGWETPILISLFGAVGAFVASIRVLSRMQGTRNPFNLPFYQLLLKLATGPLFALFGITVLQSNVISELNPASSMLQLLVWAGIFGSAQQAVTQIVDRRVSALVAGPPEQPNPASQQPASPGAPG